MNKLKVRINGKIQELTPEEYAWYISKRDNIPYSDVVRDLKFDLKINVNENIMTPKEAIEWYFGSGERVSKNEAARKCGLSTYAFTSYINEMYRVNDKETLEDFIDLYCRKIMILKDIEMINMEYAKKIRKMLKDGAIIKPHPNRTYNKSLAHFYRYTPFVSQKNLHKFVGCKTLVHLFETERGLFDKDPTIRLMEEIAPHIYKDRNLRKLAERFGVSYKFISIINDLKIKRSKDIYKTFTVEELKNISK